MAIYDTFFLCSPADLSDGFPGWLPPLPEPVRREVKNPFTGAVSVIETRKPEWPPTQAESRRRAQRKVVSIKGSYSDYLESRLMPFLRQRHHQCLKDLTEVELNPAGQILGSEPVLDTVLYAPPSSGAMLQEVSPELVARLGTLDRAAALAAATKWAEIMSTPEHTHSVTGQRLSPGWAASDALIILRGLIDLAGRREGGDRMYLLVEW